MARYITHPAARSLVAGGFVAGILGGFLIHAFFFAIGTARYPGTYEWIASGIVGRSAFTDHLAWLGVIIHFCIAIVAVTLYAYIAQIVGLLGKPLLGGVLFGIVTNGVLDLVVFARWGIPLPTTWHDVAMPLVAHVVFFGIPVALLLSRYERVPVPYA